MEFWFIGWVKGGKLACLIFFLTCTIRFFLRGGGFKILCSCSFLATKLSERKQRGPFCSWHSWSSPILFTGQTSNFSSSQTHSGLPGLCRTAVHAPGIITQSQGTALRCCLIANPNPVASAGRDNSFPVMTSPSRQQLTQDWWKPICGKGIG